MKNLLMIMIIVFINSLQALAKDAVDSSSGGAPLDADFQLEASTHKPSNINQSEVISYRRFKKLYAYMVLNEKNSMFISIFDATNNQTDHVIVDAYDVPTVFGPIIKAAKKSTKTKKWEQIEEAYRFEFPR